MRVPPLGIALHGLALLGTVIMAAGCAPPVAIDHVCTLELGPTAIIESHPLWGTPWFPSTGRLGDAVLVSWIGQADPWPSRWLAWWDLDLGTMSEPERVAYTVDGGNLEWVVSGEELVAQSWLSVEAPDLTRFDTRTTVFFLGASPGLPTRLSNVRTRIQYGPTPTVLLGYSGPEGIMPTIRTSTDVLGFFISPPFDCDELGGGLGNYWRVTISHRSTSVATPLYWGEEPCALDREGVLGLSVSAVSATSLSNGDIGLVVRLGDFGGRPPANDGSLHYLRISATGEVLRDPVRVGGIDTTLAFDTGLQPRAVAVDGGRVLFTERRGRDGLNTCHGLRAMNEDGSGAGDTPWQLPCASDRERETRMVLLSPMDGGALLVWEEHARLGQFDYLLPGEPYDEAIYATYLNAAGQRASEIIRISGPESRTFGEVPEGGTRPGAFLPHVSTHEGTAFITWTSDHPDTPGIYAARLHCEDR